MMGEEIDENTRSIFPVELDDDIVLEDTKEWVQRGDCDCMLLNLNLVNDCSHTCLSPTKSLWLH